MLYYAYTGNSDKNPNLVGFALNPHVIETLGATVIGIAFAATTFGVLHSSMSWGSVEIGAFGILLLLVVNVVDLMRCDLDGNGHISPNSLNAITFEIPQMSEEIRYAIYQHPVRLGSLLMQYVRTDDEGKKQTILEKMSGLCEYRKV